MTYHEITLHERQLVRHTLLRAVVRGTLDLIIVVVKARNVAASEFSNFAGRAADTATNVQHLHAVLDADLVCKVMFMSGNGLVKVLANRVSAEVERLAPPVLIQVRGQVIVAIDKKY